LGVDVHRRPRPPAGLFARPGAPEEDVIRPGGDGHIPEVVPLAPFEVRASYIPRRDIERLEGHDPDDAVPPMVEGEPEAGGLRARSTVLDGEPEGYAVAGGPALHRPG